MKLGVHLADALVVSARSLGWAATVTITDCTAAPAFAASGTTRIDVRPDDLVLACQLAPLPGTSKVKLQAHTATDS